jgi:polyhydroxyalkanoate synthase
MTPYRAEPADLDRLLHDWQSRFTGGRSPSTVSLALLDWAAHAANAPFQTAAVGRSALAQWQRLLFAAFGSNPAITPWAREPYATITKAVLLGEEWWEEVVNSPRGVSAPDRKMVTFTVRQALDMLSPSNVPWLNPQVIDATRASGGENLVAGLD